MFSLQASQKLEAATGQQCLPLSLDVRQPQTIVAAVEEALKKFERIDILVNGELLERAGGTFGTGSLLGGVFPCVGLCLPSVCFGLGVSGQPLGAWGAQRKHRPVCDTWPSLLPLHQHPPALALLGTWCQKLLIPSSELFACALQSTQSLSLTTPLAEVS